MHACTGWMDVEELFMDYGPDYNRSNYIMPSPSATPSTSSKNTVNEADTDVKGRGVRSDEEEKKGSDSDMFGRSVIETPTPTLIQGTSTPAPPTPAPVPVPVRTPVSVTTSSSASMFDSLIGNSQSVGSAEGNSDSNSNSNSNSNNK